MQLAMAYYPAQGVDFVAQGVTPAGLPALAILHEDTDLALDVSHSFWATWGDALADGVTTVANPGVNLTDDLLTDFVKRAGLTLCKVKCG